MTKFKNNGFSMVELLLVLAVISVVSIIGLQIAQRGMEKAYDTYIYTGYRGLIDAIWTANAEGHELPEATTTTNADGETVYNDSVNLISGGNLNGFINSMAHILTNDNLSRITTVNDGLRIETQNRITYLISRNMLIDSTNGNRRVTIIMTVPRKRTAHNNQIETDASYIFFYYPDENFSIPITTDAISMRRDLLPFYNDDGVVNRVLQNEETGNVQYSGAPEYISMRQAFCEAYGTITTNFGGQPQNIYDCTGIPRSNDAVTPTPVSPSKAS